MCHILISHKTLGPNIEYPSNYKMQHRPTEALASENASHRAERWVMSIPKLRMEDICMQGAAKLII